jgi:alpha-L-rhamnosidase
MQKFAKVLNKPQDVQEFSALAAKIKAKLSTKNISKKVGTLCNNSVTSNLLPLYFDMVPVAIARRFLKI